MHPFSRLNDVVAVGPDSFYTTQPYYSRTSKLLQVIETFLGLRLGAVFYYGGKDVKKVESGLIPNGINVSPDGRYVNLNVLLGFQIVV